MKGGQTPIHIMRWAPADFVNDTFVRGLVAREDFATFTLYKLVLDYSHIEGGDLPAEPRDLAAVIGMSMRQTRRSLAICIKAGKLQVERGRLYHRRVKREVEKELSFRDRQAKLGREGGRLAGRGRPLIEDRAIPVESPEIVRGCPMESIGPSASSPPSAPSPAPAPIVINAPTNGDDGSGTYVTTVLELYCRLPGTREKPSTKDRKTAAGLYQDGYSIDCVRAGLLTATARRELRNREQPLPPIGSLAYFLDAIKEARASPPEEGYVEHLATKIEKRLKGHVEQGEEGHGE